MKAISVFFLLASFGTFVTVAVQFFWTGKDTRFARRILRATTGLIIAIALLEISYSVMKREALVPSTLLTDIMQVFSLDAGYDSVISRTWSFAPNPAVDTIISIFSI